jgi:uncharacterized protein
MIAHRRRSIHLMLTKTCNLRCRYCYGIENRYEDAGEMMSIDTARKSVDFLIQTSGRRGRLRIFFFGGEPLLNFDVLKETVEYSIAQAKRARKQVNFSITTNGLLLTEDVERFLLDHDFAMMISVDGPKECHDAMRRNKSGEGSYEDVVKNVRRLLDRISWNGQLRLRCTLNHLFHDYVKATESLRALGTDCIGIGSAQPSASGNSEFELQHEDMRRIAKDAKPVFDEISSKLIAGERPAYNPYEQSLYYLHRPRRSKVTCGVCRNDITVDTGGQLYPCHRYVGMKEFIIGSVEEGVDNGKVGRYYKTLFRQYDRKCLICWLRGICNGPCPWSRATESGSHVAPDPVVCGNTKRAVKDQLWLYCKLQRLQPELLSKIVDDYRVKNVDPEEGTSGEETKTA